MVGFFKKTIITLVLLMIGLFGLILFLPDPLGVSDREVILQANEFSIFEGIRVQRAIDTFDRCPSMPEAWSSKSTRPEYQYETSVSKMGKPGSVIPVRYKCSDDLKFLIWARYSIDSDLFISGEKGEQLTIKYGDFSRPETLIIPVNMDENQIRLKLREAHLIAK